MKKGKDRRSFIKKIALGGAGAMIAPRANLAAQDEQAEPTSAETSKQELPLSRKKRQFGEPYRGAHLDHIAFPIGGMGAGMFCIEGSGAITHMSIRNRPEIFHDPGMFAVLSVKNIPNGAKVLEGPVPDWKIFGQPGTGNGASGTTFGLPRFANAEFSTYFPFGKIKLRDPDLPLHVQLTAWSPFIPTDPDNSSLPVGGLEYEFLNQGTNTIEAVFSFNVPNFLAGSPDESAYGIAETECGFTLYREPTLQKPELASRFSVFTLERGAVVDYCWFRGGWWDPLTVAWNRARDGVVYANPPVEKNAPGASLYVPFSLAAGRSKTIRVLVAWFCPDSDLRVGEISTQDKENCDTASGCCNSPKDLGVAEVNQAPSTHYKPWYSSKFGNIEEVIQYWKTNYQSLLQKTRLFSQAFYASNLAPEVMEAVAANLTILKSPTVLRQFNGRLWNWEGCSDDQGCCHGSCTHVWNYAQAMAHLFPSLERSLRDTEFCENQNKAGHQTFRANMPISPTKHDFYAAADGQLGGIMKVHRDWLISGDSQWLARIYPMVKTSMDYCIATWDPRAKGVIEEPHHNTYDIEFWGPDGMCMTFYAGALHSMVQMGNYLKKDVDQYQLLLKKAKEFLESRLYNGEYFFQDIEYKGLNAPDPATAKSYGGQYSPEAVAMLQREGPKYQYGTGCLSDGVLGAWITRMCGLDDVLAREKITSHLNAVHKYNLKKDLREHANPQRPSYALGNEGGLLLCSWPRGGKLSLPFVYSDEVWTGIEYQVASHLMLMGEAQKGLEIVRTCRSRYDGRVRNPFNEYECGHWYGRAMSSYGLIQGLTGLWYNALDRTLQVDSKIGDFTCFLSTASGFGTVRLEQGTISVTIYQGEIQVDKFLISGIQCKGVISKKREIG